MTFHDIQYHDIAFEVEVIKTPTCVLTLRTAHLLYVDERIGTHRIIHSGKTLNIGESDKFSIVEDSDGNFFLHNAVDEEPTYIPPPETGLNPAEAAHTQYTEKRRQVRNSL